MIDLGPHTGYILSAYGGVLVVVLLAVGWTVWRGNRVKARLAALEAQGIRRRSDGTAH